MIIDERDKCVACGEYVAEGSQLCPSCLKKIEEPISYESKDPMVSHPKHYASSKGLEVIDVIDAFTEDLKGIEATDTGNIIKYACRWNNKGQEVRDIEKIIWYATHLLNKVKERIKK